MLKAVITGDIIRSRDSSAAQWLSILKAALNKFGKEPVDWEIFRGDSFQLLVEPKNALKTALIIKAMIKQLSAIDIRMGIGIGEITYKADKITEANGSAFVNSGESFDHLQKKTLSILTPWDDFNKNINLMLELLEVIFEKWTEVTAEILLLKFENPDLSQKNIAQELNKSQSSISEGLSRSGYDEISNLLAYYEQEIQKLCTL